MNFNRFKRSPLKPLWIFLLSGFLVGIGIFAWVKNTRTILPTAESEQAASSIPWLYNENDALRLAKEKKKAVVIDFTADWCMPCQELESEVFENPEVIAKMKNVIPLRLDVSEENEENQNLLDRYNIQGLPSVIFINAEGQLLQSPRILGAVSPEDFLSALDAL